MQYDFDTAIDRTGTDCVKWDFKSAFLNAPADALPMWIADMDFPCAQPVIEALHARVDKRVFGYSNPCDNYYEAVVGWFARRHDWTIDKSSIFLSPGVVPALTFLLRALTGEGDAIVIQPPVYNPFHEIIEANDRVVRNNPLIYENGTYRIDFAGLDAAMAESGSKGLLFCSPHNPAGRVWTRDELKEVAAICRKHGKWMISDEIHCDLVRKSQRFQPMESAVPDCRDIIFTCTSPSKGFNLAGLMVSNIIINNPKVQTRYLNESMNKCHLAQISPFAIDATIAAYTRGEEWLDQVNAYIDGNVEFAKKFIAENMPGVSMADCQGTYLLWLDFARFFGDAKELSRFLLNVARVALNDGHIYGENGACFARINAACPRSVLTDGLQRIAAALKENGKK